MGERRAINRIWYLTVNVLGASPLLHGHQRLKFLRRGGIDPQTTQVRHGSYFFSDRITFGRGGLLGEQAFIENRESVSIGDNVYIGPRVYIATSSHDMGEPDQRAGAHSGSPVIIESGCWIGANVTILPGVTVARGCMVAAGAVVKESTEANGLYAGVPARRRSDLPTSTGAPSTA